MVRRTLGQIMASMERELGGALRAEDRQDTVALMKHAKAIIRLNREYQATWAAFLDPTTQPEEPAND